MAIVVDAGPLYAYVDADDRHHRESIDLFRDYEGALVVPVLVIAEVVHLIGTRLGAIPEIELLGDIAFGDFVIEPVDQSDWLRIAELVSQYRDISLGTVDASVVTTAERLGVTEVATFDRRDFSVVRARHTEAFTLLP